MAFSWGKNKKEKPSALVKHCKAGIVNWTKNKGTNKEEKAMQEIAAALQGMKLLLYGDDKIEPSPTAPQDLAEEFGQNNLWLEIVDNLNALAFEARRDLVIIFGNLIRRQIGSKYPLVDYLEKNTAVLDSLCKGYEDPENALTCGQMLRVCIEYEPLAKHLLHSLNFAKFFHYVETGGFDIASDAFSTFKELLTKHKVLCAEFLESNYDTVFDQYTSLLHSNNYVTRRQSLKLLGELLLDRANFNVMTKYISDQENLKLMMTLLRDKSKNIQFEAFHVFKVFVANPNKAKAILDILIKNKERLIVFLKTFQSDRVEDEQFADEKAFLLKQIEALPSS